MPAPTPPAPAQPRLAPRANFSHSSQRVRQILRDNAALVKRLGCGAWRLLYGAGQLRVLVRRGRARCGGLDTSQLPLLPCRGCHGSLLLPRAAVEPLNLLAITLW